MICKINYIESAPISNTEKERLTSEHISIFTKAKESGAFRSFEGKLFSKKEKYNEALKFIADTNKEQKVAKLVSSQPGQFFLSVNTLPLTKEVQLPLLQEEGELQQSIASPITIEKVKELIRNMGIDIRELTEYTKSKEYDISGLAAIADITGGVIAIAEGKEAHAITEEMVHIATSIVEFTNPKTVTEMIAKIDRFKIYKQVLEQYKDNKNYQLSDGKPDIRRIKKEAADKLIAELIVNNAENTDQFPELKEEINQSLIRKWWNDILDWIRGIYRKANIDIFQEIASDISEGKVVNEDIILANESPYFQLSDKQKEIQDKIAKTQENVKKIIVQEKTDPILLDSEEASNFYELKKEDGTFEKILRRVTDRVKSWYKKKFPGKVFSKEEKELNELKRQYGVQGHADLEEIHSRYYHEDGTKRETPLPRPEKFNVENQEVYDKLEKYYTELIATFPPDSLILSEVIIYDEKQKEAGTIDFLAIEPSGKTHILDWKFMNVGKGQEDVAWYKQGAYNIQISRYKDILKDNYGIKEFGMKRAIPILMKFGYKEMMNPESPLVLKGINIGNVDVTKIVDLRLLPVAEETESTGDEVLDSILKKLNTLLDKISKEKASSDEERKFKFERMNILHKAIRRAHLQHNVAPLIDTIEIMRKEGQRILNDYNVTYKDRPATSADSTNKELSDFSEDMREFIQASSIFEDISDELQPLVKENIKEEQESEKIIKTLQDEGAELRRLNKEILKISFKFADKHIGERNLVVGLSFPEKVAKGLNSTFKTLSEFGLKSTDLLYRLIENAQGKASTDALKEINMLVEIEKKLKDKGGDIKKTVQSIYNKTKEGQITNRLVSKINPDFYKEVDKMTSKGGDLSWIKENIDIEVYKKDGKKKIQSQIEYINKNTYPGTKEEVEERKKKEIERVNKTWDIESDEFIGWNNYLIKSHPLEKWLSEEYKSIQKDPELLELYNFIVNFNKKASEIGYIDFNLRSTFLPFIRKSMAEELVWDGTISPMQAWRRNVELKAGDVGYGQINDITGELENTIPRYFTHDFTKSEGVNNYSEISYELFKNLIVYIQHVEKYKYLREVEEQIKLVKTLETFKDHLETSKTGGVVLDENNNPKVIEGNQENARMFDDFMRTVLYDQKYILSDSDTPLQVGKVANFFKKSVNDLAGREIFKENETPTVNSMIKTIDALNKGFQMKTLGLEFIPGAANFFGANLQLAAQAGKYFEYGEYWNNYKTLAQQSFNEKDKELFIKLINTFMPLKDDPAYAIYKQAGMSTLTRGNLGDTLFVFMRKGEQIVEKSIFLSLLQNTMVENGKLVNIKDFVNRKYSNRYSSANEYNESKKKIQKEIEELKSTKSIAATKELKDGELVIPGLDLKNKEEIQRLTNLARNITNNVTGSITKNNINRAQMSIWTKSMMVFKNWIAPLYYTRFDVFRKVGDDFSVRINEEGVVDGQKYDIGRIRLLGYILGDGIVRGTRNLKNILYLNDQGLIALDKMYEDFSDNYFKKTGEPLNMTKDEFIDLIRTNVRNQMRELLIFATLLGMMISMGFITPDDDDDRASKNLLHYSQRVIDKFVQELSFFYNPAEWTNVLNGGVFPAVGIATDFGRFTSHFFKEITGMDLNPLTDYEETRKRAQPIKNLMKMAPITKSMVTYMSLIDEDFAKEFDVTIQKENR